MASDEESKLNYEENIDWNVENEIRLFEAMIGHKPVGINKHFHMACISEKFETLMGKPVSSDLIWKHLGSMFDLAALDKKESLPFPNEQEDFSLPETEFSDLINEKLSGKTETVTDFKENTREVKPSPKIARDFTPAKETLQRKEKKSEVEELTLNADSEKKESLESESDGKKGKSGKEDRSSKRRGNRNVKEKKLEEETPQSNKKEEDSQLVMSGNRKEKRPIGKRSLRSRIDDSLSNKSLTPPPVKRARRI